LSNCAPDDPAFAEAEFPLVADAFAGRSVPREADADVLDCAAAPACPVCPAWAFAAALVSALAVV
jgi:hypothetical protein